MCESRRTTLSKAFEDYLSYHQMNKDSEATIETYRIQLWRQRKMCRYMSRHSPKVTGTCCKP